jgi:hypothetical protein
VAAGDDVLAYQRELGTARFLVALNFASAPRRAGLELAGGARVELCTGVERAPGQDTDLAALELGADEGLVLRLA